MYEEFGAFQRSIIIEFSKSFNKKIKESFKFVGISVDFSIKLTLSH